MDRTEHTMGGDEHPYGADAIRALEQELAELNGQMDLLPFNSRLRVPLISRIRDLEDQIGWARGA